MQHGLLFEPDPLAGLPGTAAAPDGRKSTENPGPALSVYLPQGLPSAAVRQTKEQQL